MAKRGADDSTTRLRPNNDESHTRSSSPNNSFHSHPNFGASISAAYKATTPTSGLAPPSLPPSSRKCSVSSVNTGTNGPTGSRPQSRERLADMRMTFGGSKQNIQRDSSSERCSSLDQQSAQRSRTQSPLHQQHLQSSTNPGRSSNGSSPGGDSPNTEPRKSKRLLNQWRQAASMSKFGNRTRNLLGKWKSHSQSVDIVGSAGVLEEGIMIGMGSDPSGISGSSMSRGSKDDNNLPTKKTQWSEHVWTAWVHRGFSDDVTEVKKLLPGGDLLTDFQKDKFRYFFFHVLDLNSDNVISAEDFEKLNERIRHYMDWSVNSIQYLAMKEVHSTFLECFLKTAANFSKQDDGKEDLRNPELLFEHWKLGFPIGLSTPEDFRFDYWDPFKKLDSLYDRMDHVTITDVLNDEPEVEQKTCVTIDEWIDVWGTLVGTAKKLDDFPMWVQYYPKILFDIINRSGTGVITKSQLKYFYTAFLDVGKLGEHRLEEITNNAFSALTSGGDIRLTYHIFKLSFLNFLLGKQPNGPGQFIFGTVTPRTATCMFPVDYSAMNATDEDIEPFRHEKLEEKGSRRSVLV
ncbi:uncharacterized protein LOC131881530 [Tigriopus californicus]|uniref:uncharacterized protein LOC131881530 n=1 Tax=Tigriopus californicus TaxID=6832 RepID=UPI0027DAB035|nr:uncharacterized protein LOC131881530 [Tigriopus californicus]